MYLWAFTGWCMWNMFYSTYMLIARWLIRSQDTSHRLRLFKGCLITFCNFREDISVLLADDHCGDSLDIFQSVRVKVHQQLPHPSPHGWEGHHNGHRLSWRNVPTGREDACVLYFVFYWLLYLCLSATLKSSGITYKGSLLESSHWFTHGKIPVQGLAFGPTLSWPRKTVLLHWGIQMTTASPYCARQIVKYWYF